MKELETDRLILRRWKESDLDDYFEYVHNPNVGSLKHHISRTIYL